MNLANIKSTIAKFHADEQGAEGAEKILIIAAVVLPLLLLLIFFKNTITEWVRDLFGDVRNEADSSVPTTF
jgi:Flp pilus assembly pilin Flp